MVYGMQGYTEYNIDDHQRDGRRRMAAHPGCDTRGEESVEETTNTSTPVPGRSQEYPIN